VTRYRAKLKGYVIDYRGFEIERFNQRIVEIRYKGEVAVAHSNWTEAITWIDKRGKDYVDKRRAKELDSQGVL
jgi:hypothetical protein